MFFLLLAFQNSMHVRLRGCCRCHAKWNGRSNHQARHGIKHPHTAPSYPIMLSYDSLTLSLYLQLGHNVLDH
jgi:hypothetical protein